MGEAVEDARRALSAGGVIVIPTDTVYGLATRADDQPGVERLYDLKGRPQTRPFQVLVDGPVSLEDFGEHSDLASALASAFWPGPLTIVVRASARAPAGLVHEGRIGLRAPDHEVPLALVAASGPLAATSANRSGKPTPATVDEVRALFGDAVAAYIDGGVIETVASTVVDVAEDTISVLREGSIGADALRKAIGA